MTIKLETLKLDVDVEEAQKLHDNYSPHVKKDPRYRSVVNMAEAILSADGHLVNVRDAIREIGMTSKGHPKLALANIRSRKVKVDTRTARTARFQYKLANGDEENFNFDCASGQSITDYLSAIVPMTPPNLVPADAKDDELYILFEPEWEHKPPVDPILLKRINGDLFTIVAQWDLTAIEQMVLG